MKLEMKVPVVGESISEVTVAQWFKSEGDHVERDEVICELESDKASFEVPADASGTLHLIAEEGDTIEIGAVICTIDADGEAPSETPKTAGIAPETPAPAAAPEVPSEPKETGEVYEMRVPSAGESITEVTMGAWTKESGDFIEEEEVIVEIESDKATFEIPAEKTGVLEIVAQEGDILEIGGLICRIKVMTGGAKPAAGSPAVEAPAAASAPAGEASHASGHPSPAAAKILAEKGVSPEQVSGTGVGGRITKADASSAQKPAPAAKPAASAPAAKEEAPVAVSADRGQERKKMSSLRRTVARRLVSVKNETAMLTTFNEVDMKPIMDLRKQYKEKFKDKFEVNLGFMSFFTKACTIALQEWPAVNAQIDGNDMVYNNFCDVSIAVSSPKGLVVPVIRNAEKMSFNEIEQEVVNLALKARAGKLTIEEMTGGTFTITNGGIFGSMLSTPIINAPQSAILGMHNIVERPVAINGQVEIRPIMYVALSYDHRIIDGRESVSFLKRVKELLEDPTRMLLGI
ncbi:2-oxoglutarate dehydrogenase complex dihydrolipoyllysine-residue succinyltransferase [Aureibacter tunicatorum]|uniref:Dihydrolipoyllysine-residue succinyltransferase component of 2-oxoglutarate dehydrogenase complex n=1 Tax=Aureibacter tunicatorum TaxID=866807 RepID=A0AAE4BRN4_9BACT|nr:2-oxoglutarate dehydrogenase complex dihydrolipoyllysine-residue succinyltransferase [Aureibacter tunicatorum]MDR6237387.1 2-oxoglutarate dehydrogenase E2 component (dihydrolipoamide succinyltransferase) [Aureibacter tunicatorum]BDD06377.1 dihydrolipoyllysine-residue succinyltransferase component of 2-oxoglutarate dehydrogenase complex [Aureibacter tunicatorum]